MISEVSRPFKRKFTLRCGKPSRRLHHQHPRAQHGLFIRNFLVNHSQVFIRIVRRVCQRLVILEGSGDRSVGSRPRKSRIDNLSRQRHATLRCDVIPSKYPTKSGWVLLHLLFGAIYFLILTPIERTMRLIGNDSLRRHPPSSAVSYWMEAPGC